MAKTHRISLIVSSLTTYVTPQYDGLTLQEERPEGEVFMRATMDTEFVFVRGDFDYLLSLDLTDEIEIAVEESNGAATPTYTEKWRGVFTKADCEWDEDNKLCRVRPRTRDDYEKVLEGLNKEYNLIDLEPAKTRITYKKKPIIQVYIAGTNYLSNFTQGNYWETPLQDTSPSVFDLLNTYFFFQATNVVYIPGDNSLNPDVSGVYALSGLREDGLYEFDVVGGAAVIRRVSDAVIVYQGPVGVDFVVGSSISEPGAVLTSTVDGVSKVTAFQVVAYYRYLTDQEIIAGVPTQPIPANDIVAPIEQYTRVIGLNSNSIAMYSGHQVDPTKYGRFADDAQNFAGEYFTIYTPAGAPAVGAAYPVTRSDWQYFSIWFEFDPFLIGVEESYSTDVFLYDAYSLAEVVKAFLAVIDPNITYDFLPSYSVFFHAESAPMRLVKYYPFLTPKSNIIFGNYDQPAKKAPLRFGEFLQFLKDFYKVYWFIQDGKFRLEHLEYFEKGGSYAMDNVGIDLTLQVNPKNRKAWAYRTARYTYDRADMPERIEFNWMDPQSPVFDGYPIEMNDPQVEKGNVETRSLAKFSADIDYIATNPGEIARDGFVWIEADYDGNYYVPTVAIEFDGLTLNIQNGRATLAYAHEQYHKYQLPCENVTINNAATTAESVIKTKVQEIEFPDYNAPASIQLVTTGLGNGKPRRREIDLISGMTKTTLYHDQ